MTRDQITRTEAMTPILAPIAPAPITLRCGTARIEIHAPEMRMYPDTVTVETITSGARQRQLARCRPNHQDLDRLLSAAGVPADVIATVAAQVLAMLSAVDGAWLAYGRAADAAERTSPITVAISSSTSGNTWEVRAHYDVTGRPAPRHSVTDGESHPTYRLARMEADERATAYARRHAVTRDYPESVDVATMHTQRSVDAILRRR